MKKAFGFIMPILMGLVISFLFQLQACVAADHERITVDELKNMLDNKADIVVVDVRSKEIYNAGHIPGSISMPFADEIKARHAELPQDKLIVLY